MSFSTGPDALISPFKMESFLAKKINCFDHVTNTLKIPKITVPNEKNIAELFTHVTTPEEANAIGVKKTYSNDTSDYIHMGLIKRHKDHIVIDHIPNVGHHRKTQDDLINFQNEYGDEDGISFVYLRSK